MEKLFNKKIGGKIEIFFIFLYFEKKSKKSKKNEFLEEKKYF
jgi:hypothetical protein